MQNLIMQTLVDKAEDIFNSMSQSERKSTLFETYMDFLKKRAYGKAARELREKISV